MKKSRDPLRNSFFAIRSSKLHAHTRWGYPLLVAALLAAATLLAHGWSIADGPTLDDHWHQKSLRELGWSYGELMEALVIEPARFIQLWWQDKVARFEYGRPFFIVAMKFIYGVLGGNSPAALHLAAALLHFISALLVTRLCLLLTRDRFWSLIGGLLFVLYHHAAITVAWSSSFNIVLATTLMLGAVLAYLRASRLEVYTPAEGESAECRMQSAERGVGHAAPTLEAVQPPILHTGFLLLLFLLWIPALLTRENAVMIPVILACLEWAHGGWRRLWARRGVFVAFGAVCVVFVLWRMTAVRHGMPDLYMRRPDGDLAEYLPWLAAKLLHYVCASIWPAPMVAGPTGRYNPWTEVPGDCLLMLGLTGLVIGWNLAATRRMRGAWTWLLWILLAVLPVVPVIATPHSGYLPGVGFAVAMALAAVGVGRIGKYRIANGEERIEENPARRSNSLFAFCNFRFLTRSAVLLLLVPLALLTMFNRWQWVSTQYAEEYTLQRVLDAPPEQTVTDVFFLNLPFVNIYVKPALVERIGPAFESVACHALTFAPDPFLVSQPVTVEQLDAHTFRAGIERQAWFSRLLGRLLIDGFREGGRFQPGDTYSAAEFDVRVDEADGGGVWQLTFRFRRPLADPRYAFYVFTPECNATRLRFRPKGEENEEFRMQNAEQSASIGPLATNRGAPLLHSAFPILHSDVRTAIDALHAGTYAAADTLFAALGHDDPDVRESAAAALRDVLRYTARATAAPVQRLLGRERPAIDDNAAWEEIRRWWHAGVDDAVLAHTWGWRDRCREFDDLCEEVPHARTHMSKVIRTDLYLTGPPFADPR